MKSNLNWKFVVTENMSYKIVALFIAVILWLTIMGRRDLILTKNIEIEFKPAPNYKVVGQTADQIRLRLSGPRTALKEVMGGTKNKPLTVDISDRGEGSLDVDVPVNRIELPAGVKILSVRPNLVRVEVQKSP
jgi:YbbR domain-containing protein